MLLHGLGSSRRDLTAVLPALTERFDVINVDLPESGGRHTSNAAPPWSQSPMPSSEPSTHSPGRRARARQLFGRPRRPRAAIRGRARSVVAIAPSGFNIAPERLYRAPAWRWRGLSCGRRSHSSPWPPARRLAGRAPGAAEGAAVEHLAGGGDRRARRLRRVARLLAHGLAGADVGRPPRSGPDRLPGHSGSGRDRLGRLRPDGALPAAHPRVPLQAVTDGRPHTAIGPAGHDRPAGRADGGAGREPDGSAARRRLHSRVRRASADAVARPPSRSWSSSLVQGSSPWSEQGRPWKSSGESQISGRDSFAAAAYNGSPRRRFRQRRRR